MRFPDGPLLPHAEFGPNNQREDAPLFKVWQESYLSKPAIGDMTIYATAIIMKSIPTRTSFEAPDTPDCAKSGSKNGILKSIPDQVTNCIRLVIRTPGDFRTSIILPDSTSPVSI